MVTVDRIKQRLSVRVTGGAMFFSETRLIKEFVIRLRDVQ